MQGLIIFVIIWLIVVVIRAWGNRSSRQRCVAVTKSGAQCKLLAFPRSDYCQVHDPGRRVSPPDTDRPENVRRLQSTLAKSSVPRGMSERSHVVPKTEISRRTGSKQEREKPHTQARPKNSRSHGRRQPVPNETRVPYLIVDLPQRSSAWLEWRNQGIGASDASAIMGENPWKTPEQMLKEKVAGWNCPPNELMARGAALEPEARKHYERDVGVRVRPACIKSTRFDWFRASVDGLSSDGSRVVEIKCGKSAYRETASTDEVPHYHFAQLQHILAVTGLPSIDFWCYLPGRSPVHLHVDRDDRYIKRLLKAEEAFWDQVIKHRKKGKHRASH